MKQQFLYIILTFSFLMICSCCSSIYVCSNHFEKEETLFYNQIYHNAKEDTVTRVCNINIYYPSICGLQNKIIEDSINQMLKNLFLADSDCCVQYDHLDNEQSMIDVKFEVRSVSNKLVSITSQMLTNCGAGGGNVIRTFNIDLKNGKLLERNDIFKQISQQKLEEEILKIWLSNKQEDGNQFKFCDTYDFLSNFEVAFTENDVVFIFNKSGLCGPFVVERKKVKLKNIMNSKYL